MTNTINLIKVKSVCEIKSPYADDEHVTLYFNRGVKRGTDEFKRAKQATQKELRVFDKETEGRYTMDIAGRKTHLKAFKSWLIFKKMYKHAPKKPEFVYKEK